MNQDVRFKEIEQSFEIPELVIHQDCESIFNAHWNFEDDLTFEELLECACGGEDSEGNELPETTLRDDFEATKNAGFWAFSDSIKKQIHVWKGNLSFEELLIVLGHELGHQVEASIERPENMTEDAFEEDLADYYGWASLWAFRYATKVFNNE